MVETGVRFHRLIHRREAVNVFVDGAQVVVRQLAEVQPRHDGEGLRAGLGRAVGGVLAVLGEPVDEILFAEAADAGVDIGADMALTTVMPG